MSPKSSQPSRRNLDTAFSKILECQIQLNNREQYLRNWSIRITGLEVSSNEVKKLGVDLACMYTAYHRIIKPVLQNAVNQFGETDPFNLSSVPGLFDLIENAHFVGRQVQSKPRTIIVRFRSRYMRNLFLKYRRSHMPAPTAAEVTKGVSYFTATPDLTRTNYVKMKALRRNANVTAAWTLDGHIFFKLRDKEELFNVDNVFEEADRIVRTAMSKPANQPKNKTRPKRRQHSSLSPSPPSPGRGRPQSPSPGRGRLPYKASIPGSASPYQTRNRLRSHVPVRASSAENRLPNKLDEQLNRFPLALSQIDN